MHLSVSMLMPHDQAQHSPPAADHIPNCGISIILEIAHRRMQSMKLSSVTSSVEAMHAFARAGGHFDGRRSGGNVSEMLGDLALMLPHAMP